MDFISEAETRYSPAYLETLRELHRKFRILGDVGHENGGGNSKWDKAERREHLDNALGEAILAIINNVPPCGSRYVAIKKIREARLDADTAVEFDGDDSQPPKNLTSI